MRALNNTNRSLTLVDGLQEPARGPNEVKVQVHYASLNPTDDDIARGEYDFLMKLYRVRSPVRTGLEFSGTVIDGSAQFPDGTKVFGYTNVMRGPKTHQDVISIPEAYIAAMPEGMSLAEAAAFPLGAQTSLVALRDVARLKPGQSVMLLGASGGLGVYAIQLAKRMQVSVTGVSGPEGLSVMSDLGADRVINYRQTPLPEIDGTFDAVIDLSARYKLGEVRHLLKPRGIFVPADPLKNVLTFVGNVFRRQKAGYLLVDRGDTGTLTELAGLVQDGALKIGPYTEFAFEDFEVAFASLHTQGRVGRKIFRLR